MLQWLTWLRAYAFGNKRVIPSLDGIRAISVCFVIAAHLCGTIGFPLQLSSPVAGLGSFGVRIFFIVSGYLITGILHSEMRKTGTISLPRFYFRRTLRLFPAAYVFIGTVALLSRAGYIHLREHDLVFALTYTSNYYVDRSHPIGHLWSLAVEEQFYMIWPAAFLWLGKDRGIRFLCWVLIVVPPLRLLAPYVSPWFQFVVCADELATGCLLALIQPRLDAGAWRSHPSVAALAGGAAVTALLCNYIPSTKVGWLVGDPVMNLCIAFVIYWVVTTPDSVAGRILNYTPIAVMGALSYSIYLWQQLFSYYGIKTVVSSFPLCLLFLASAALASFLLVEGPCLRLRDMLERRMATVAAARG